MAVDYQKGINPSEVEDRRAQYGTAVLEEDKPKSEFTEFRFE